MCCGMYFPSYYSLRSSIVPDEGRATILNFFRIPLNGIVLLACTQSALFPPSVIFFVCVCMLGGAAVLAYSVGAKTPPKTDNKQNTDNKQGSVASQEGVQVSLD
eukprot:Platyproteum_vivax@DN6090_c0_g1_i2.p1